MPRKYLFIDGRLLLVPLTPASFCLPLLPTFSYYPWGSPGKNTGVGHHSEGGNRTRSILKAGLHLRPDCGL